MALTHLAHQLIKQHFADNSDMNLAIDATCGNGHDTEFLATMGFEQVLGFDIQQCAIKATQYRINQANLSNVKLIQDGHEHLAQYVDIPINCAMFNLGYLPHGDKSIATSSQSTIGALTSCLGLLAPDGIISILCYPGHPQGTIETATVQQWLESLSQPCNVEQHLSKSPKTSAPILYQVKHKTLVIKGLL